MLLPPFLLTPVRGSYRTDPLDLHDCVSCRSPTGRWRPRPFRANGCRCSRAHRLAPRSACRSSLRFSRRPRAVLSHRRCRGICRGSPGLRVDGPLIAGSWRASCGTHCRPQTERINGKTATADGRRCKSAPTGRARRQRRREKAQRSRRDPWREQTAEACIGLVYAAAR